jgi:hypothetical protein
MAARHTFGPLWCVACARLVRMVSPEAAARISGVTAETINRRIENRSVHCMKTTAHTLLICRESLIGHHHKRD